MIKLRVSGGSLKGRIINPGFRIDDADMTPQKVKGAVFSMLGESLYGKNFLDLYSCSGQMGIEAASRGAAVTVMNELDRTRFASIKKNVESLTFEGRVVLMNSYAVSAVNRLSRDGLFFDAVFIDAPYDRTRGETGAYDGIMNGLSSAGILKAEGSVIVQHYSANKMKESSGSLNLVSSRKYGTSALSVYQFSSTGE